MTMTRLVLFDIDGTMLSTAGASRRAVHRALEDVFGAAAPEGHEFDGKTDPQIVRELMQLAGLAEEQIQARLPDALVRYVELLGEELGDADHADKVYPGVSDLLDALETRDDVVLGLLTGNVRDGAMRDGGTIQSWRLRS